MYIMIDVEVEESSLSEEQLDKIQRMAHGLAVGVKELAGLTPIGIAVELEKQSETNIEISDVPFSFAIH